MIENLHTKYRLIHKSWFFLIKYMVFTADGVMCVCVCVDKPLQWWAPENCDWTVGVAEEVCVRNQIIEGNAVNGLILLSFLFVGWWSRPPELSHNPQGATETLFGRWRLWKQTLLSWVHLQLQGIESQFMFYLLLNVAKLVLYNPEQETSPYRRHSIVSNHWNHCGCFVTVTKCTFI